MNAIYDEELIRRAATPDPDAPPCPTCGGGLAHFPECGTGTDDPEQTALQERQLEERRAAYAGPLCKYESAEPGTLLCVLPADHEGVDHDTPRYADRTSWPVDHAEGE